MEESADEETRGRVRRILVVVPWLEGGGAQGALAAILDRLETGRVSLVILFRGSKDYEAITARVGEVHELNCSRSVRGVWQASRALASLLRQADVVYSLMRASHVVLGLISPSATSNVRLAASFHQLPSSDSTGLRGKAEDFLVRRGLRSAGLVTTPSSRAVSEVVQRKLARASVTVLEANLISTPRMPVVGPRRGVLESVRLVFAGRITDQKGLDRVPGLLNGVDIPVHLRILGDGEERQRVADSLHALDKKHKVELLGRRDDIQEQLDWADAAFMPSRAELNPLFVWEAWSRGRPVIASQLDVFEDLSKIGPILEFRDGPTLGEAIKSLAQYEKARDSSSQDGTRAFERRGKESKLVQFLSQ